jgi:hypothetical protein
VVAERKKNDQNEIQIYVKVKLMAVVAVEAPRP